MIMDTPLRSKVVFHLTGRRPDAPDSGALPAGLRPALLASYRQLEALRHDFPVVLADGAGEYAVSLTDAVDGALRTVAAPGLAGEAVRKRALQAEKWIRRQVAAGATGSLAQLWTDASAEIATGASADDGARDLAAVGRAFTVRGQVVGCDVQLPARLVTHAWRGVQREKALAARNRIDTLVLRLEEILRADVACSPAAFTASALEGSIGVAQRDLFDFQAMARLLQTTHPRAGLPASRRRRIEAVLATLRAQAFFPEPEALRAPVAFDDCIFATTGAALDAFLERLPAMVELYRALQVAELEVGGRYSEELHDGLLAALDEGSLAPADLAFFPDLLVCVSSAAAGTQRALTEAMAAGVPLKVVVQLDDVLEQAAAGRARFAPGVRGAQLASATMGLGDVFVLQSAASNLLQARDAVQRGLRYPGAALYSVYAGPPPAADGLPSYLACAAAMDSRAFPAFCFDPGAGADFASRFSIADNRQLDRDWPADTLAYADPDLQAVSEDVAFTYVDFALCDPRYAGHFTAVPRAEWNGTLVPAARWLEQPPADPSVALPYVLAVDDADLLCRLVVDESLMRAALRCREEWHRLQELAGINDSRLQRALEKEREAFASRQVPVEPAPVAAAAAGAAAAPDAAPAPTVVAAAAEATAEPARNPDEAYVETERCSTCNECTTSFPKMFAYNADQQAYIKDLKSGTYRQLIEAAEACQVSVIHPGKPWNPDEPGLEELLERAQPFL